LNHSVFSALTLLVGCQEEHLACKKIQYWGAGVVICLEWDANDLHMIQLMPLPPIISCLLKSRMFQLFWYLFTQVVLEKRPLNQCLSVCLSILLS